MASTVAGRDVALDDAWTRLTSVDARSISSNSGADTSRSSSQLFLRVLDEECIVDLKSRNISCTGRRASQPGQHLQILILHYLLGAGNAQLANRLATYREFSGGALYFNAFKSRSIDRIVREFADKPDLLKHVADAMHAEPVKMGSVAFKVNFFPKIPVTIILWLGDEEIPASANILFDANAGRILPTEDLSVVGGELVSRLVALAKV